MEPQYTIRVIFSKEVAKFLKSINPKAAKKMADTIRHIASGVQDPEMFKKLKGHDIWEFRSSFMRMEYRILGFWDKTKNSLILTTHGFVKKSQETPLKEIEKAEAKMKEYYNSKS